MRTPIERIRGQLLAQLRRGTTSPDNISSKQWWGTAFPGHPYGRPNNGTLESVPQINADDLKSYVSRVFARETLTIGIVGDIDAERAGRLLDQVFGGLPAKATLPVVPDLTIRAARHAPRRSIWTCRRR